MLREVSIAAALCKAWSERELFYDAIYSLDALSEGGWNAAPPGTGWAGWGGQGDGCLGIHYPSFALTAVRCALVCRILLAGGRIRRNEL